MASPRPTMRGIAVPVEADPVEAPVVSYGDGPASINLMTRDDRWARVTFEKLDSLRVSRGEYEPYPSDWKPGDPVHWAYLVEASPWLQERYEYERRYYGNAYEFCGDVDEMLTDFSHFVFRFHDQFVEAVCAGIWFEVADACIGNRDPDGSHPLLDLPSSLETQGFEAHGIRCQVRTNPRSPDDLIRDAGLCSQKLFQFAPELDGTASVACTVSVRVRDGKTRSYLRSWLGKLEQVFEGVPALEQVRPRVERWLGEIRERRNRMGKA